LYARYGLRCVFGELVMRLSVTSVATPVTVLPLGLRSKAWTDQTAPLFFSAYAGSFADRPGFAGLSEAEWLGENVADTDFAAGLPRVAIGQSEPCGFVTVAADGISQIGVVPAARRRGLAATLLREALHGIAAQGHQEAWLTVATNNSVATR
jgi:mycothiol synthase